MKLIWLVLSFPRLGLELRWRSGVDRQPAQALYDPAAPSRLLLTVNAAAAEAGVKPGQTQVHAQSLLADLRLHPVDRQAESAALTQLATWALRYSAEVRIEPPDRVALEIGASLKLFGGLGEILTGMRSDLQRLGYSAVAGLGRSLPAARLRGELAQLGRVANPLAQPGNRRLAPLHDTPIGLLPLDGKVLAVLQGSGLQTLGALLKIPDAALQRRFGNTVVNYLQRLKNQRPEPGESFQPPRRYQATLELPAPTALGDGLWFPIRRLINDLCFSLQISDLAVDQLYLDLDLERGDDGTDAQVDLSPRRPRSENPEHACQRASRQRIECQLLEPSRDPAHLFELFRQRVDRTTLVGKVLSLSLEVPRLPPPSVLQQDLFSQAAQSRADWPKLLERLRARLGPDSLQRPQVHADLRPERACDSAVGIEIGNTRPPPVEIDPKMASLFADLATRPSWLLAKPQAISPNDFRLLSAAERLEGGWWDGADIRRDYYRAVHVDGGQCWVFQELRAPGGWYLHGWFG